MERREAERAAVRRRAENLDIVANMMMRVPAIDDLVRLLDESKAAPRVVKALRAELARRRGGRA
jgi:hypothetical protein